jgi:riboflavin transporter FmnP
VASVVVGPVAGALAALINSVLFVALTGQGGPWGAFMHFVASGGMALVIGYLAKKTGKLHVSMLAGIATRVALMVPLNLLVTPIYTGAPRAVVMGMIVPIIIPFNLIHAGINTALSFAVLKVSLKNPWRALEEGTSSSARTASAATCLTGCRIQAGTSSRQIESGEIPLAVERALRKGNLP